jgi:Domain of unknown function (DUF4190)
VSYPPYDEGTQPQQPGPQGYPPPPAYPQPGYQQPGYPPQYSGYQPYMPPQDHPQATLAMILGIVGVVLCGICAPFAWVIGKRAMNEIDASGGTWGGRGQAQAGFILGIIGSVFLLLAVLYVVFIVIILGAGIAGSA